MCLENKSPVAENTHTKKSGNICKTHTLIFSKKESVFVAPFSFFLGHYSSNFVVVFWENKRHNSAALTILHTQRGGKGPWGSCGCGTVLEKSARFFASFFVTRVAGRRVEEG